MSTDRVYTPGQILTAAQMNDLMLGLLTSASSTTDVGPTVGTTELDIIAAPAVTIASATRKIRISFVCKGFTGMTAGDVFQLRIKEGATVLQEITVTGTAATSAGIAIFVVVTPSAASHTYKTSIQRTAGTGVVTVIGGGATGAVMQILVEDIGT